MGKNQKDQPENLVFSPRFSTCLFFFFFCGQAQGICKFLGQGSNPWHSRGRDAEVTMPDPQPTVPQGNAAACLCFDLGLDTYFSVTELAHLRWVS